ncbi:MAG TPA: hypothetical protein VJ123_10375 [Anaerolineales bacterium]|nr:hypothetical protein [Anaerolineales bacterium]
MKRSLDEAKLLDVANRRDWRDWLQEHYKSEREVWLVYHKKHTGKPRVSYNRNRQFGFGGIEKDY